MAKKSWNPRRLYWLDKEWASADWQGGNEEDVAADVEVARAQIDVDKTRKQDWDRRRALLMMRLRKQGYSYADALRIAHEKYPLARWGQPPESPELQRRRQALMRRHLRREGLDMVTTEEMVRAYTPRYADMPYYPDDRRNPFAGKEFYRPLWDRRRLAGGDRRLFS